MPMCAKSLDQAPTPLERRLLDIPYEDEPFPGAGLCVTGKNLRGKHRPPRKGRGRRLKSPPSAAKFLADGFAVATSQHAFTLYFLCVLIVFFAQNL